MQIETSRERDKADAFCDEYSIDERNPDAEAGELSADPRETVPTNVAMVIG